MEKYDKRGKLTHAEETDDWGRKASYDYKAGEAKPNKITRQSRPSHPVAARSLRKTAASQVAP